MYKQFYLATTFSFYLVVLVAIGCREKSLEPLDSIPPSTITSLAIIDSTSTRASLRWQASGDDGMNGTASEYDLRFSTSRISKNNWNQATRHLGVGPPLPPLQWEFYSVTDLDSTLGYYFAVRVADEIGNWSEVSNIVTVRVPDTIAPSPIVDLAVIDSTSTSLKLTWTAHGDDNDSGTAALYDIRFDNSPLNDSNWLQATIFANDLTPKESGHAEEIVVTGLSADSTYYFGIRIIDEAGNASPISNIAQGVTLSTIMWETTLGGSGHQQIWSMISTMDKGLVLVGQSNSAVPAQPDAYLVKLDSLGNVIWEKTYGGADIDYVKDVVTTYDNAFLAVGTSRSFGTGTNEPYLLKFSDAGDLIWEKTISDTLGSTAESVDGDGRRGHIIGGVSSRYEFYIYPCVVPHAMLLKISNTGVVEWWNHHVVAMACPVFPCAFRAQAVSALELLTGGYALGLSGSYHPVCGHTGADGPPSYFSLLKRTDNFGNTLWDRGIESDLSYGPGNRVFKLPVERFLTVGFISSGVAIQRMSPLGTLDWKTYNSVINVNTFSGAIYLKSGNVMLAAQNGTSIKLIVFDGAESGGGLLGDIEVIRDNTGTGELLVQTPDGNIVVAGWVRSPDGDRDTRIVKIRNPF